MTFEQFSVVSVPFPFTDKNATKKRPALIISDHQAFNAITDKSIMAMITSADHTPWPFDIGIQDLDSAGLPSASIIRMKLFTLDHLFINRVAGHLTEIDTKNVKAALKNIFNF